MTIGSGEALGGGGCLGLALRDIDVCEGQGCLGGVSASELEMIMGPSPWACLHLAEPKESQAEETGVTPRQLYHAGQRAMTPHQRGARTHVEANLVIQTTSNFLSHLNAVPLYDPMKGGHGHDDHYDRCYAGVQEDLLPPFSQEHGTAVQASGYSKQRCLHHSWIVVMDGQHHMPMSWKNPWKVEEGWHDHHNDGNEDYQAQSQVGQALREACMEGAVIQYPDGAMSESARNHRPRYFQTHHEHLAVGQNLLEAGKAQIVVVDVVKLTQNH
ncbi:hypothetical protein EDD22DRAFT_1006534 [Suillus occidentalis]|nr:hypothetical protein EDD22DRAFT_1006534 [Suillus occidentalis]